MSYIAPPPGSISTAFGKPSKFSQHEIDRMAAAQSRFLAAFSQCGSVLKAARWAKLTATTHFKWLDLDPTYPQRFRDAERKAARMLEDEAVRLAHQGDVKKVRYKGKVVGEEKVAYPQVLMFLLRAYNPDKFKERIETTEKWDGDINKLTDDQRIVLMRQLEQLAFGTPEELEAAKAQWVEQRRAIEGTCERNVP